MKVLVVDDDQFVLDFLKTFFETNNHQVTLVDNPADAMKKLVVEQPDLVLLDIMLPGKDGLTVLKEMKDIDKGVSVAMITGYKDAEKVIEAFRLGAIDCLLKPFNVDYILSTVLPKVTPRKS